MPGFVTNLEKETLDNEYFRKVLFTSKFQQLVVMSILPNQEIGEEVHNLDQFIKIEEGIGVAVLDGERFEFESGFSISIPKGVVHNIINSSTEKSLKLYTIYSPPEHPKNTIHKTKEEAQRAELEEKAPHVDINNLSF